MRQLLFALLLVCAAPLWAAGIHELTWSEMVPADAPAQSAQQAPMHDLSQLADVLALPQDSNRQRTPLVQALDNQRVKLPGYIVPLNVTDEGQVIEFLFTPYFGACIHVPPPPANQIVHVTSKSGVLLDVPYQPFWIEGTLQVGTHSSELATAGYQMAAEKVYPYEN